MSAELKYTTNFPNPESGGTYSGTDLPAFTEEDVGKVVSVIEDETGPKYGLVEVSSSGATYLRSGKFTYNDVVDAMAGEKTVYLVSGTPGDDMGFTIIAIVYRAVFDGRADIYTAQARKFTDNSVLTFSAESREDIMTEVNE